MISPDFEPQALQKEIDAERYLQKLEIAKKHKEQINTACINLNHRMLDLIIRAEKEKIEFDYLSKLDSSSKRIRLSLNPEDRLVLELGNYHSITIDRHIASGSMANRTLIVTTVGFDSNDKPYKQEKECDFSDIEWANWVLDLIVKNIKEHNLVK